LRDSVTANLIADVAILGIIKRWHFHDQVPLREIAKRLGISRNTVLRYLQSKMTEPSYAEGRSASAIAPYAFQLSGKFRITDLSAPS